MIPRRPLLFVSVIVVLCTVPTAWLSASNLVIDGFNVGSASATESTVGNTASGSDSVADTFTGARSFNVFLGAGTSGTDFISAQVSGGGLVVSSSANASGEVQNIYTPSAPVNLGSYFANNGLFMLDFANPTTASFSISLTFNSSGNASDEALGVGIPSGTQHFSYALSQLTGPPFPTFDPTHVTGFTALITSGGPGSLNFNIDQMSLTPEPCTAALILLNTGAFLGCRRFRGWSLPSRK